MVSDMVGLGEQSALCTELLTGLQLAMYSMKCALAIEASVGCLLQGQLCLNSDMSLIL